MRAVRVSAVGQRAQFEVPRGGQDGREAAGGLQRRPDQARKEIVAEKPAYRQAFAYRRCLLPADGYYEWQPPYDPRGRKQPVYLSAASGEPLALAGLWERWTGPDGQQLATVSC